jgi:hypothetical protein
VQEFIFLGVSLSNGSLKDNLTRYSEFLKLMFDCDEEALRASSSQSNMSFVLIGAAWVKEGTMI